MLQLNSARYLGSISRHFKSFPVPDIFVCDESDLEFSGLYLWPDKDSSIVDYIGSSEVEIPPVPNGALLLRGDFDEGTLLHEYRHHLQYCVRGDHWTTDISTLNNSDYFLHDSERDAFEFEVRMTSCSGYWAELGKILPKSRTDLLCYVPLVVGAWWL